MHLERPLLGNILVGQCILVGGACGKQSGKQKGNEG